MTVSSTQRLLQSLAISCGLALSCSASAHLLEPSQVPVDRLVDRLNEYLAANPSDAVAHYRLARVHYLAFSIGQGTVAVLRESTPAPEPASDDRQAWQGLREDGNPQPTAPPRTPDQQIEHLNAAIVHFNRAIRLDGDNGLYKLGLACLMEEAAERLDTVTQIPLDPAVLREGRGVDHEEFSRIRSVEQVRGELLKDKVRELFDCDDAFSKVLNRDSTITAMYHLRNDPDTRVNSVARRLVRVDWRDQTSALYFAAFTDAAGFASVHAMQPIGGFRSLVAYQAGTSYLRYADSTGERNRVRRDTVEAALEAIRALPQSTMITPIIFSLDDNLPLADLLAPETVVRFDLDGTGRGQAWPWVRPTTGILVWDPARSGVVTSGRQLFGSVTWWIFFDDGFQAMRMLDDDADGVLAGEELAGLSVWFDLNADGVSQPGEVVPIELLPIRSIATTYDSREGELFVSHAGLTLTDGSTLPVYDWVTAPVGEKFTSDEEHRADD